MKSLRLLYSLLVCQLSTVTLIAATPAQPISMLSANATTDTLRAYNTTFSNFLPIAPYFQPIYGTGISIIIYAFGRRVPVFETHLLYTRAIFDAVNIHDRAPTSMGPGILYTYNVNISAGELGLHLAPGDLMTWQMWAWVCNGLMAFTRTFEYVELKFDVVFNPYGTVAQGSIEIKGWGVGVNRRRLPGRTGWVGPLEIP